MIGDHVSFWDLPTLRHFPYTSSSDGKGLPGCECRTSPWLVGWPGWKKNFPVGKFFRSETHCKVLLRHIYIFQIFSNSTDMVSERYHSSATKCGNILPPSKRNLKWTYHVEQTVFTCQASARTVAPQTKMSLLHPYPHHLWIWPLPQPLILGPDSLLTDRGGRETCRIWPWILRPAFAGSLQFRRMTLTTQTWHAAKMRFVKQNG
jgi:hypothetical protein